MATESPDPLQSLLREEEKGEPADAPLGTGGLAYQAQRDNDGPRRTIGYWAYAIGALAFAAAALWAGYSIDRALVPATETIERAAGSAAGPVTVRVEFVASQVAGLLYIAKAILLVAVAAFSFTLFRIGDNLTMPVFRYLQLVERKRGLKETDGTPDSMVEMVTKIVDAIRGSKKD